MRWSAHYDEVSTRGGMVTAADEHAAVAGAEILAQGGNAVDAAVATAFVLGVAEPPMSGLGGGTLLTIRVGGEVTIIDGGICAPQGATAAHFPLAETEGAQDWAVSFYDWPPVVDAANVLGARSIGVPGTVAALLLAHDRFGRMPRAAVMKPAISLAADGFEINWFLAALIASNARSLGRDRGCADVLLRGGLPLRGPDVRRAQRLVQPALAETLGRIASDGAPAFYEGAIAKSLVACAQAGGGLLSQDDLASYEPLVEAAPPGFRYKDVELVGPPTSGFPSVLQALEVFEAAGERGVEPEPLRWAYASKIAMVDRFHHMSADPADGTPWGALVSASYARDRLRAEIDGQDPPDPATYGDGRAARPARPAQVGTSGLTSHHCVVDAEGNAVSATQTVLNTFGARVLDPATGVLFNDGIAYFDPRAGSRNSIQPGARAFSAMSPMLATRSGELVAAFGASGGRRIIAGTAQISRAIATGTSMQSAVEAPRVYAESDTVLLDVRWPDDADAPLRAAGFTVERTDEQPTTVHFARPNGILVDADGVRRSGVDPKKPGAAVPVEL